MVVRKRMGSLAASEPPDGGLAMSWQSAPFLAVSFQWTIITMDWNLRQVIEPIESLQLVSFEEQFVTQRGGGANTMPEHGTRGEHVFAWWKKQQTHVQGTIDKQTGFPERL